MKNDVVSAALAIVAMGWLTNACFAEPLKTMDDVGRAIATCWKPAAGLKGTVTLSFSFKRDGTLIGPPRPTNISVAGDSAARDKFIGTAVDALKACTPLTFSPDLAEGMGGQVFTMPFTAPADPDAVPTVDTQ